MKRISDEEIASILRQVRPYKDIAQTQLEADQKDIQDKIDKVRKLLDEIDTYYIGFHKAARMRLKYSFTIGILEELLR